MTVRPVRQVPGRSAKRAAGLKLAAKLPDPLSSISGHQKAHGEALFEARVGRLGVCASGEESLSNHLSCRASIIYVFGADGVEEWMDGVHPVEVGASILAPSASMTCEQSCSHSLARSQWRTLIILGQDRVVEWSQPCLVGDFDVGGFSEEQSLHG